MNTAVSVRIRTQCPLPTPPVKWKFRAYESFSKKQLTFIANAPFLADHCGSIHISLRRSFVYDYLGLFRIPVGRKEQKTLLILPEAVPVTDLPSMKKYLAANWIPKPGGGFSDFYDLREYRPGDDLRQIHWKLAAKTGKTILREPMIPLRGKMILSVILNGLPEEIDRKLGRLKYLSDHLLEKDLPYELYCMTGEGLRSYTISTEQESDSAIRDILRCSLTDKTTIPVPGASWHYEIGGEADEG
ncbi:MAG: DUF58 domain-containing protein [Oscillospiraceae bacterium]|nr:DUF58 domain-containing protein [Oscillospiraceae bacterium]